MKNKKLTKLQIAEDKRATKMCKMISHMCGISHIKIR